MPPIKMKLPLVVNLKQPGGMPLPFKISHFFKKDFLCGSFLKSFIEFVTILLLLFESLMARHVGP